MIKKTTAFIVTLFSTIIVFAQSADELVTNCINTNDYFLLAEIYPQVKDEVQTALVKDLAESLLYAAFNHTEQAIPAIDSLIAKYHAEIGLESTRNMLYWQCNLLFREGRYQDAIERLSSFLQQFDKNTPDNFLDMLKSNMEMNQAMLGEETPLLIRPKDTDCIIPIGIDTIRIKGNEHSPQISTHITVPVIVNNQEERFILDTGCPGGAFLSKRFAERMGVRIKIDSLQINGAGGTDIGQMGILDSLQLGNMTLKNITVAIVPPNPGVDTLIQLDAILGTDIMRLAGEMQIFPCEKKIIFPANKTPLPTFGRNMIRYENGDSFLLKVFSGNEKLIMLLDTGDVYSRLNYNFYSQHKIIIDLLAEKESYISGGFGGAKKTDGYYLPYFPFKIGDANFKIEYMQVETEPTPISNLAPSGSLGMAFINSFDKVTISFDHMFVDVE